MAKKAKKTWSTSPNKMYSAGWPRRKFQDWPEDAPKSMPTAQIVQMYNDGFIGAARDPEVVEEFKASLQWPSAEDAAHEFHLADTGAGKLVIPFVHILEMFPGCWPGKKGQARGDCVSWGCRNGSLASMVYDIVSGQPDEKTNKPEAKPEVPLAGIEDGVLSTEAFYWHRGYNGDGWMCAAAAKVATTKSGFFVRKPYPELNIDLTSYSGSNAGKWGSSAPPSNVTNVGAEHLVYTATFGSSLESLRDLLFNGYAWFDCGSEAWSSTRDANGVSVRSGSWAHSLSPIAVDDRDIIKAIYGEPLVCILNSWAIWNSGPRDIYQSASLVPPEKKQDWIAKGIVNQATGNIMIPAGSFWTKWSSCKNRERIAFSGGNGWAAKSLPDWGTGVFG